METDTTIYRPEELLSSFYKIETIDKINYKQYLPKDQDERWSIQMELNIRKQNPRTLVALLSKELWCFSINDDPIPSLPPLKDVNEEDLTIIEDVVKEEDDEIKPEKVGNFNADYSKPNLPPYYALFLKALRRTIYINLALKSNNSLIQFGNAFIPLMANETIGNPLYQIEPHLFSNSDLAVSVCIKDLKFTPLTEENLNEVFLRYHALYIAPSGIRAFVKYSSKQSCLVPPPKNADTLLNTLCYSHGINLKQKKKLLWISLIPHLGHLNGQTPSISSYMTTPTETRSVVWPLDLCFAQPAFDVTTTKEDISSFENFQDAIDMVDDFIQIRQSSAYRTPGSSGALGTNPLSSGGGYTEQFQHFNKKSTSSVINMSPLGGVPSTITNMMHANGGSMPSSGEILSGTTTRCVNSNTSPSFPGIDKAIGLAEDSYVQDFVTTPNSNENNKNNELFNDRKPEITVSPIKNTIDRTVMPMDGVLEDSQDVNDKELFGDDDEDNIKNSQSRDGTKSRIDKETSSKDDDIEKMDVDDEEEDDEDLFGETSGEEAKPSISKLTSDEITEDMFEMSDDEDSGKTPGKNSNFKSHNSISDIGSSESLGTPQKIALKRKYLDIPSDEMTLSNSPLYTDPGAPLPIETPRERRRSVFAPLTFNPIIENNVDNKYKNGGKFSFSPSQKEEALKFDVSTAEISSSEEENSDSSLDSLDYPPGLKSDLRSLDGNIHDSQFTGYHSVQYSVPSGLLSSNFSTGNELYNKDGSNSIWRLPQNEMPQTESPLKSVETSIPSPLEGITQQEHFGKAILAETSRKTDLNINRDTSDSVGTSGNDSIELDNMSSTSDTLLNVQQRPTNSLPFLLRHMSLSSMPDVFLSQNPSIRMSINDQNILNLLCEQIVFDYSMFQNLGIPQYKFEGAKVATDGLVYNTMKGLFSRFDQISGNELIDKFYSIKQPYVFVKKHEEVIKIKSDVQNFTKFLNLRPPFGMKNFKFLLLTDSFKNDCLAFVSTLSQTYISQEFGFCELLKLSDEETNGLIYLKDFEKNKLLLLAAQIVSYCSTNKNLGKDATLMIIIPLANNTLAELILKTKLFQIIRNDVRAKLPKLELFFKVIPIEIIKNPLISVDSYYNLCSSIYNILPAKEVKFTTVAHKLPESITFRTMKSSRSSPVIHYDAYIHLAYSRSVDKQWMFAALSDSDGKENMIKSWYVGNSKTIFDNSCNEIWLMALSLASKQYGKICLILTRLNGILPDDELMNWRRLSGRNIHLAVVCVDDNTKVSFFDQGKIYPTFRPLFNNENLSKSFNPNNIKDYEIRDINQDIHGVIFESPFPLANSQHRCAIKSGALVKFKADSGDSPWDKFEVNLLNCPHSDSGKLLETILEEFRNLAALNVWFGITNGESSHIPWHVLAVKKMMSCVVHTQVETTD